jgi:hypothetical protein
MNQNIYNPGFSMPVQTYYSPSHINGYKNQPYQMNFVQPNFVNQITTPRHHGNFNHGFHGQINFYDPITGKPGPVVNTLPTMKTIENRPYGSNLNLVGNTRDVRRVKQMIKNNILQDVELEENELYDLTEENLDNLLREIEEENNRKKKRFGNIEEDTEFYELNNENINILLSDNRMKKIRKIQNLKRKLYLENDENIEEDTEFYDLTDENLDKLLEETKISQRQNLPEQRQRSFLMPRSANIYPNRSWKLMGDLLVHPSLTTTYSGSGILLFDKYVNFNTEIFSVIMGQESDGKFGDFGGLIRTFQPNSIDNSLVENAKSKILEESCNHFNIQSNIHNFDKVDVTYDRNNSLYRCFLIGVQGDISDYTSDDFTIALRENRAIYKKYGQFTPEMNNIKSIVRFNLQSLFQTIDNNSNITQDVDGNQRVLTNRVIKILRDLRKDQQIFGSVYGETLQSQFGTHSNGIKTFFIN